MTKIETIQQILAASAFYGGKIDGKFGPKSRAALATAASEARSGGLQAKATVEKIQTEIGTPDDGWWGPKSAAALESVIDTEIAAALSDAKPDQPHVQPLTKAFDPTKIVIREDGWIEGVWRQPLPGRGPLKALAVVNHFTGGADGDGDRDGDRIRDLDSAAVVMAARGLSAHVVVDRDGSLIQCVSFLEIAFHAGPSQWRDPVTGDLHSGTCNTCTIGIEIANAGDDIAGAGAWARKNVPGFAVLNAPHWAGASEGGMKWEIFYPAQIATVTALSVALVQKYGLHDVTGHDRITKRKNDPGPAFDAHLLAIREACGFTGMPAVLRAPL